MSSYIHTRIHAYVRSHFYFNEHLTFKYQVVCTAEQYGDKKYVIKKLCRARVQKLAQVSCPGTY